MKVLVVGSGGREHAIVWKLAQSQHISKLYCAPGNAGISELAECINIKATEIDSLLQFAKDEKIDLTIVGMDDPLMLGIVDRFEKEGLKIFGPNQQAAIIEGSKAFAKDLMKKYNIPTASSETFSDANKAIDYLKTSNYPIVLKADGLALGKGVLICQTLEEAIEGVNTIMVNKKFGDAGNTLIVEEFLTGKEVSVLAFCDGEHIIPMTSAQDHKRAKDFDQGLNTGGMGTFSPSPFYTEDLHKQCIKTIYEPSIKAMKKEGRAFTGILFVGLMLTKDGPKVLEYNARFGDPEAQVVLPRLKNDLVDVIEACISKELDQIQLEFTTDAAVCVVLASDGYPISYKKGYLIKGLESFQYRDDVFCFHAGTKKTHEGIATNGGRVLGVVAKGDNLKQARENAYKAVNMVDFDNKYYRTDIGKSIL